MAQFPDRQLGDTSGSATSCRNLIAGQGFSNGNGVSKMAALYLVLFGSGRAAPSASSFLPTILCSVDKLRDIYLPPHSAGDSARLVSRRASSDAKD